MSAQTYTVFRDYAYFEKDGYFMYNGVAVHQEYDNGVFWYTMKSRQEYEKACSFSCCECF